MAGGIDYEVKVAIVEQLEMIANSIAKVAEPRKENAVLEMVYSQDEQMPGGGWARVEAWMVFQEKRLKTCWLDIQGGRYEDDYLVAERRHFDNMAPFRLQRMAMAEFDRLAALVEAEVAEMQNEIPF